MRLTPFLLRCLSIGLLVGWVAPAAQAALSVSPTRVVLQGKPDDRLTGFFTVANQGEAPLEVRIEPEDWSGGMSGARGPVDWLHIRSKPLRLRPGKSTRVKYTIRIPGNAHGELRTQVFFTTETSGGVAPMRSRLGAIIYVGIRGTQEISGEITKVDVSYTASTPGIKKPDRLDVAIRVHNTSNVHIAPEGSVVVRDETGRRVATVPLQSGWGLLPKEEDLYHAIGHGVYLAAGRYTIDVTVICGGDIRHPITATKTVQAVVTEKGALRLE